MAHGAGPGPVHLLDGDIAMLQDLERRDELLAGEGRLGLGISERRQRPDHIHVAGLRAVIRLDPPNGDEDGAVDAVALLQLIE